MSCYFSYVFLFFKDSYICLVIFLMSCYFSKVATHVLLYFFLFARTLKVTNKTFAEEVWRYENARQFLLLLGWTMDENDGGKLVLHEMFHVKDALNFLIENRFVSSSSSHLAANLSQ